ncbi:MAG: 50S ribosomal protein L24 [Candidatus Heimdallarchaeota archaeon]|nr:50S ribosomal protein L24 [Candidatus Heimdallarchaeota archaeon]MCK5048153.1 50S ribosomal protein L24 [Candidatus Heimdallarchaeota archaeon]
MTYSTKPKKQRKRHFNAPLHTRHKKMATLLDRSLREKYGFRNIPINVNDTVKIVRGQYKGITGRILRINRTKYKVHVEGAVRNKVDGSQLPYPISPSNIIITKLNEKDRKRVEVINRKSKGHIVLDMPELEEELFEDGLDDELDEVDLEEESDLDDFELIDEDDEIDEIDEIVSEEE